ncbi:MAG: DEAD/DEAH box helicase [Myxococcales bacterium]|nr:DEAD/DEAH box helicase [Myxococcales bacterium]
MAVASWGAVATSTTLASATSMPASSTSEERSRRRIREIIVRLRAVRPPDSRPGYLGGGLARSLLGGPGVQLVFDRGTLLLRDLPPALDPADLPGILWDQRVAAWRAPARRYREIVIALVRKNVRFSDGVRPAGQAPDAWPSIALRPYQDAALCAWELSSRRGVVALPTGSGKTQVALAAMARTGLATLCLVPTRVLLEQWLRELARSYPGPIGCFGDGERRLGAITVATFESAYRHMDHLGNLFDLLIVDEAHHFGCGMRDEALEMSTAAARLGLTATPPRDDPTIERLAALIGPVVYELGIGDLAGRFLAPFDLITWSLDLGDAERTLYEAAMSEFRLVHARFRDLAPSATWPDFARWAARTPEGRRGLAGWRRAREMLTLTDAKRAALALLLARHRDARVLIFTADNESAYAISRRYLVMPLTCDIGRKERDDALARFRLGELRALVSARVLNEGLDVPEAEVGIVVGGSLGEREHVQRVGRLLRPAPGKQALVYDLVTRGTHEVRQAKRRSESLVQRRPSSD